MSRDWCVALPRDDMDILLFVIVVFPDHTHLLFGVKWKLDSSTQLYRRKNRPVWETSIREFKQCICVSVYKHNCGEKSNFEALLKDQSQNFA